MQLGMIGLGRMGANMARRLMRNGHKVVAYDRSADAVKALAAEGATGADSLAAMIAAMPQPRHIWIMVPAGGPTESTVEELGNKLSPGDTIIDGGNSFFKDDIRRAKALAAKKISYVDAGTSGGVYGLERGYCMMIGGDKDVVTRLDPIFKTLAPGIGTVERTPGREKLPGTSEDGYLHCGPVGSGHFVKMVHNGIEYGIMQALAEGFDILKGANNPTVDEQHRMELPVADIAEVWRRGSVLSSWLVDLTAKSLVSDPQLTKFAGSVQDSGEGRWTVMAAIEESVSADVIAASLFTRFRSRQEHSFAEKLLSAMRFQFGGHVEKPAGRPFHVALSGGSTPKKLFDVLASRGRAAIAWDRVELWWGDERCVPPDHADSNYGMTKAHLIDPLKLDPAKIHRLEGERPPGTAAGDYEHALVAALGSPPVFDLVWLGMGPDGHTASLFPNSFGVLERGRFVIANAVDSPLTKGPATRLTVTLPVIDAARHVRFLVGGVDKADTLAQVRRGPNPHYPSSLVAAADTVWFIDNAAGSKL